MMIATTNAQKYSSMPYPKGCRLSAGRDERFSPYSRSNWLPLSTREWMASLSMAELPV